MKTFEFRTLGCKVNQYESQALREKLLGLGFGESQGTNADIYIVNTCAVTQKAEADSIKIIRRLSHYKPGAQIFVTGCALQNNPDKLRQINGVTGVLDNRQKEGLRAAARISKFHQHARAFLKIQDGCNNGCSYCIIPKLRGASRSRALLEIVEEARNLADNGYKEIVLCGICLGAYGKDSGSAAGLVKVIEELEKIEGLGRIRLSSIEASDVSCELVNKMRNSKKLCRHLHIPFQSGDDNILKLMKRKTTTDDYRKLVFGLRRSFADIGITTDIMVGFPGEDEISFKRTIQFLKEIRPSRTHIFPFSPRQHTPAFGFDSRVNPRALKVRVRQIKALAKELSFDFCRTNLGKTLDVLLESSPEAKTGLYPVRDYRVTGKKKEVSNGVYKGYSGNYLKVFLSRPCVQGRDLSNAENLINTIVEVKAIRIFRDGIFAEPL